MPTERFQFTGEGGHQLAAALDTPDGPTQAYALFAHCFTCGKDVLAAKHIATALAAKGIAVLRFDFTGLGSSEGEFANSTFSSNVADLVRAAAHLRETRGAPTLLIGHSLGGAAILAAAGRIADAKAVVTIAAPSDPVHVTHLFGDRIDDIRKHGEVEVQLAGRPFRIKREFLDDVAEHSLMSHVAKLHKALLIMHSPTDDTVGIDNATNIFVAAKHPKSFVSLAGSDHLLSGKHDAAYVAGVIAAWAERYIEPVAAQPAAAASEAQQVSETFYRYMQAYEKKDMATLSKSFANDEKLTAFWPDPSNPFRIEGWKEMRKGLEGYLPAIGSMAINIRQPMVQVYGSLAIVSCHWAFSGVVGGKPQVGSGRGTYVFEKRDGDWVMVHLHESTMPVATK